MDSGINVFGYSVKLKKSGAHLRKCVLTVCLWVLLGAALGIGALMLESAAAVVFAAFIVAAVILLTLPGFSVEYDYEIEDGTFTVSRIAGSSRRRVLASVDLRSVTYLAPYNADTVRKCKDEEPAVRIDVLCEEENGAVMLFSDRRGRLTMLCFDANERFFKAARFYCPSAMRR